jgi:transposase-like protein
MNQYSEKLKKAMAAKILMPGGPSALCLSHETGISQTTLSKWARFYKGKGIALMSNKPKRPRDWTGKERFEAILNSSKLSGNELGVYLRKHGLTSAHLEKWKQEIIDGFEKPRVGRPPKTSTERELKKQVKALQRDLHRKDKALAETSALLILKKKAQEIWGTPEDER